MRALTTALLLAASMGAFAPCAPASAQERKHVSFVASGNSKYTRELVIDAGDAPGHKLRVYELQRRFEKDAPVIEETRLAELWIRGIGDSTEAGGLTTAYSTYAFENGDRIFARSDIVAVSDGTKNATLAAGTITDGTGRFRGIRGTIRVRSAPDPVSGFLRSEFDIDYWLDRSPPPR